MEIHFNRPNPLGNLEKNTPKIQYTLMTWFGRTDTFAHILCYKHVKEMFIQILHEHIYGSISFSGCILILQHTIYAHDCLVGSLKMMKSTISA